MLVHDSLVKTGDQLLKLELNGAFLGVNGFEQLLDALLDAHLTL